MDRDTAVQRVQEGLGFRSDLSSTIILRLQEEQRILERGRTLPKFLLREDQPLALAINTNSVTLPTDFLRRHNSEARYLPADSTIYEVVPWRNYDEAYAAYSDRDPAGPKVAVLRSSTILFFPVADAAYTIYWNYYAKADLLTTNIENDWLANAPEILIGGAGLRIARDLRNKSAVDLFSAMKQEAATAWFADTVLDEATDEPLLLGANE